jgi:hypothetical protein
VACGFCSDGLIELKSVWVEGETVDLGFGGGLSGVERAGPVGVEEGLGRAGVDSKTEAAAVEARRGLSGGGFRPGRRYGIAVGDLACGRGHRWEGPEA